jgi:hypothetical protein
MSRPHRSSSLGASMTTECRFAARR